MPNKKRKDINTNISSIGSNFKNQSTNLKQSQEHLNDGNTITNGGDNKDKNKNNNSSDNLISQGRPVSAEFHVQLTAFPSLNEMLLHFQTLGNTPSTFSIEPSNPIHHSISGNNVDLETDHDTTTNNNSKKKQSNNKYPSTYRDVNPTRKTTNTKKPINFKIYRKIKLLKKNNGTMKTTETSGTSSSDSGSSSNSSSSTTSSSSSSSNSSNTDISDTRLTSDSTFNNTNNVDTVNKNGDSSNIDGQNNRNNKKRNKIERILTSRKHKKDKSNTSKTDSTESGKTSKNGKFSSSSSSSPSLTLLSTGTSLVKDKKLESLYPSKSISYLLKLKKLITMEKTIYKTSNNVGSLKTSTTDIERNKKTNDTILNHTGTYFSKNITIYSSYKYEPICDKIISFLPENEKDIYKDKSKLAFVRIHRKSKTNLTKLELIPMKRLKDSYDTMESIKKNICYPRYKQNTKFFIVGDVDYFATIFMDYNTFVHDIVWRSNATTEYSFMFNDDTTVKTSTKMIVKGKNNLKINGKNSTEITKEESYSNTTNPPNISKSTYETNTMGNTTTTLANNTGMNTNGVSCSNKRNSEYKTSDTNSSDSNDIVGVIS